MRWIKENTIEFVIFIAISMLVIFIAFIMFQMTKEEKQTCIVYDEKVICGQKVIVK